MNRPLNILRLGGSLALVCAMAFWAHAATVNATARPGYGRVNFGFEQPTRLKASVNGATAILNFTAPVSQSPESIKASLPDYVESVTISPDKRTVTLTLNQPYRLRQFVSGNSVGVDLLGGPQRPSEPEKRATGNAPEPLGEMEGTPGNAVAAPVTPVEAGPDEIPLKKSTKQAALAATKKLAAVTKRTAKEVAKIEKKPAAKKPFEVAQVTKPASVAVEPEKPAPIPDESLLTTKHIEPATTAKENVLTTKPETPAPVAEKQVSTPAPAPVAEKSAPAPEHEKPATTVVEKPAEPVAPTAPVVKPEDDNEKPATTEPAPEPAKPEVRQPEPTKAGPFIVSTRTVNNETTINFPWQQRTAAAVFKRAQDIWIVFSRAKNVDSGLLSTVMPKQVINITQYDYAGNTVLRLVTDGTINARAEQVKGGYGWNVMLGTSTSKPLLGAGISTDSLNDTSRLILGVFDISPPLRFYDPNIGDEFIIAPSYENGRGVAAERNFPELSILPTTQGVAIITRRHDVTTSQTRSGFIISGNGGLALSESLPLLSGFSPVIGASAISGVMIPYDQWYVPREKFRETELGRLHSIAAATKAAKPDAMLELVRLYLSEGMGIESSGLLDLMKQLYPQYYVANKLALLHTAAHVMANQITEAGADLQAPELFELDEANPWRETVALFTPPPSTAQKAIQQTADMQTSTSKVGDAGLNTTPPATTTTAAPTEPLVAPVAATKPVFHFLKYNKPYIRYYPPRIRQRLAVIAAEAYIEDDQSEKALAAYDTLMRDGVLEPVKLNAELALGTVAEKKGETDQAYAIYDRLAKQSQDRRVAAAARYAAAKLRYAKGKLTGDEAAEAMELTRITWRGDNIERNILRSLIQIYSDAKRYDDVLRSQKAIIDNFPNDPETLGVSGQMGELFEKIFLDGLAEEMQPLKALSLFYEFRDMTPLGDNGDAIIQRLADRLAAIDLLDRATQLLEHQIKFRVTAEARSKVGARLALLHLLNQHPQEALNILEVTNYGGNTPELQTQRQELTAQALLKLGKNEEALGVITSDRTPQGALLRLDVLWAMQDWPNVVNHAEDILAARANLTEPLTPVETEVLLKLALGYCFEGDYVQLRYLRDYYSNLIADNAYKQIFDFITNDTTPLDPEDFNMLAKQISRTEGFLGTFKTKIAAGKLSDTVK
ncbi:MAG: hypothetical protein ACOYNL_06005 [Rickettsiales bacterium]